MIIITGGIAMKPESRDQAIALGCQHSARSRAEPGCIAHNCHVDCEDEARLVFVELWQDLDAVKLHFAVPESGQFVRELAVLADGMPEIRLFTADELPAPQV
ncbi:MAG TPA: putative quinol monooxygenase [Novosphingobium sp.]|nr:putative quinol monooxygenase [Novosphingobium sp.]